MCDRCDIAVIGAGAAGLTAAIFAAETAARDGVSRRIVVLDGAAKIGTKILISGGGRCNVTHDVVEASDFNAAPHFVRHVLAQFGAEDAVRWFESLGVRLKRERTGKLFPVDDSSRTVLNALLERCQQLGVDLLSGHRVDGLDRVSEASAGAADAAFMVRHRRGLLEARRLIVATGGRSLPRTGSDGAGQRIVARLGHSIAECSPALVPLLLDPAMFHSRLSGVSCEAELSVAVEGRVVDRRRGSLLWTHFGISGPVVLDVSRHLTVARSAGRAAALRCSFMPGRGFDEVDRLLEQRATAAPGARVTAFLAGELPARLAGELAGQAGLASAATLGSLTRSARRRLSRTLTELELPVVRERGWDFAEVTAGGILLKEVDFRTMQSRCAPGLFLAGEMLDCDGRIGGFSFQWAWSTGYIAGRSAAASLANG